MFDVYLVNFNKNRRSTERPNLTGVTSMKAKLKAPCSVLNPVIELSITPGSQGSWSSLNYAYIPDFNRYYFVMNTVLNGQLVSVYLSVDELATWKAEIKASTQYVLRSGSTFNGFVKDGKYPVLAKLPDKSVTYGTQMANPLQPASSTYGIFVVGIVSSDISLSGGVTYYAFSYLTLSVFIQQLFTLANQWSNEGQDLATALKESITDPMQYVVSIMWLPYSITDLTGRGIVTAGTSSVKVGYHTYTLPSGLAYPYSPSLLNAEFTNLISLPIPMHPQAASRGNYMNWAPFSRYFLSFYPFAGLIELDPAQVGGNGGVYVVYTVDLRTGKAVCSVCTKYTGTDYTTWKPESPIRVMEAQIGVNIPLATIHTEMTMNPLTYSTYLMAALSSAYGGMDQIVPKTLDKWKAEANLALTSEKAAANNEYIANNVAEWQKTIENYPDMADILDEAALMGSTCEMIGSQGTMSLNSRMPIAAWGLFYEAAPDYNAKNGRPVCQSMSLSGLSGFVQCDNPIISAAGMTLPESQAIETALAAGIYLL